MRCRGINADDGTPGALPMGGERTETDHESIRMLLVDDERNVLRSLERLFLEEEYEIVTIEQGDQRAIVVPLLRETLTPGGAGYG